MLASTPARADTHASFAPGMDLVHSDTPLWGTDDPSFYPKPFTDADGWGCTGRITTGDWHLTPNPEVFREGSDGSEECSELSSYGVLHCTFIEGRSSEPFGKDENTAAWRS